MNRRVARIKSVQALYQVEMTGVEPAAAIEATLEQDEKSSEFLEKLVNGTLEHQSEIDGRLEGALDHWSLDRLSRIDRAILRQCVYEMMNLEDVPVNVSINEAIDLAKGFNADEEAGKFVNGVASRIAAELNEDN
ncbi:transcription antitermination factor NusB [Bacillus luteus]|uniref:Transcription antitermination protein NusB n=1 Tax=Alkalicoccus luteus TaxID=1237094 RepID=A0A969PQC7_9BACI|nr:transcription antitermination factor NusB [Alkalicoccus luteus]NJP37635.1 transcription antitermination factor NusB [Alkalicoccus luteus]